MIGELGPDGIDGILREEVIGITATDVAAPTLFP
jgi:hypothetical protein